MKETLLTHLSKHIVLRSNLNFVRQISACNTYDNAFQETQIL